MKMRCDECRNLLHELIDGEIPAEKRAAVERHLAGCEACRHEYELLKAVDVSLSSEPLEQPPTGLVASVMANVRRRSAPFIWAELKPLPVAIAAGLLLAIFLFVQPELPAVSAPSLSELAPIYAEAEVSFVGVSVDMLHSISALKAQLVNFITALSPLTLVALTVLAIGLAIAGNLSAMRNIKARQTA